MAARQKSGNKTTRLIVKDSPTKVIKHSVSQYEASTVVTKVKAIQTHHLTEAAQESR
jgi:hypothetical protein